VFRVLLLVVGAIFCMAALALPIVYSVLNYCRATREQAELDDEAERTMYRSVSWPTSDSGGFAGGSSLHVQAEPTAVNGQVTD